MDLEQTVPEEKGAQNLSMKIDRDELTEPSQQYPPSSVVSSLRDGACATYPWTKWVESLRQRKRCYQPGPYIDGWFDGTSVRDSEIAPFSWDDVSCDKVSGGSSSMLGAAKTASMSIQLSSAPRSRTNTVSSSVVPSRQSIESTRSSIYDVITHAAKLMAIRRRHVLREIYSSEEHYVHGLRTIVQILSTYITMRPAILRDVEHLYEMHRDFKMRLEALSPRSTEAWTEGIPIRRTALIQKLRTQSLLNRSFKGRVDAKIRNDGADPFEALIVAREIDKLADSFYLYEAFIRTFDVLAEDLTLLRRNHPADGFWGEGIEALQKSVHPSQRRKENQKKSMTMDDLIAKPVQRVCKYRLLLNELLKTIPEPSYPRAYSEIKDILDRNVQAVERINAVVGDPSLRIRIKKTVSLHERLNYAGQTVLEDVYQELGPLILCGVLHAAYHSLASITGQYLVCILFPSYLVLARAGNEARKLTLVASIYLADMTVDTSVNGQGLTCLDTPFSWKVIFQREKRLYELIFSASSVSEERHWKTGVLRTSMMPLNDVPTISLEPRRFSFISLPLKAVEDANCPPLLLKRRGSIKSLSQYSPRLQEQDVVVIKKTHNPIHDNEVRILHEADLKRSCSIAVTKPVVCVPTLLMPPRSSRIKLERSIADIFSDEILPFPGMTLGPSDYLPGQTIMRKSVMRGLSLRDVFRGRRSASLGNATSWSTGSLDTHLEDKQVDAYWEVKAAEVVSTAQAESEAKLERKNSVENNLQDPKSSTSRATFRSIRNLQRVAKTGSASVMNETSDATKTRSKLRVIWKWLPLSILSLFDTTTTPTLNTETNTEAVKECQPQAGCIGRSGS